MRTTVLSVEDTRQIAKCVGLDGLMDELILRLARALKDHDRLTDIIPARDGFQYDEPSVGLIEWMPVMRIGHRATIKIVGYHPTNPNQRQLPTILSTISEYDVTTGHLLGMADATFLTALRTGAASALASGVMALPNSKVLGLIGCGAQAVTQVHALSRKFDLEKVLIFDTDPAACDSFADRVQCLDRPGIQVQRASLAELVGGCDILCTATSVGINQGPVFEDTDCKPWLHINAVGSDLAGKTEVPRSLLERSFVCPDFLDQAVREGECQQLQSHQIGPEWVHLVQNPERYASVQRQVTVFDSTGWALEDQVALEMLMDYAGELGLGTCIQIETVSEDPRDPYAFVGSDGSGRTLPAKSAKMVSVGGS